MATDSIRVSTVIPAHPERVYRAWLDAGEHGAFTGGRASIEPWIGGRHTAWDGYIVGMTLDLDPPRRIVQSWRTTEFPEGSSDSRLEVLLEPVEGGTLVTLVHVEIPEGQGEKYRQGWEDYYLKPMRQYFEKLIAGAGEQEGEAEPAPVRKPAARKPAKKKPASKPAKKKPARKPVKKKAAKKPAKKKAARKTVKKRGAKKPARRKVARKPAKRARGKKVAARARRVKVRGKARPARRGGEARPRARAKRKTGSR
jgi:uncharacterized protein YndB with AHSA1/START domain